MEISIEVGYGSREINGRKVAVIDSHRNSATLKIDGREVRLLPNGQTTIENPDFEEARKQGKTFLVLKQVLRGVAIFVVKKEKKVPRRKIVRASAKRHRNAMRTEGLIYNEAFE